MYKVKVYYYEMALAAGITFEEPDYIWADFEHGTYTSEDEATTFADPAEITDLLPWEVIVSVKS